MLRKVRHCSVLHTGMSLCPTDHVHPDAAPSVRLQELQRCTYSSYIFFAGDVALKDMLVGAASAGPAQLCEALGK
jgi:hypothetical protein